MLVERLKAFQVLFHPTCFCFSLQERPPGLGRPGCANLSSVKGLKTHLAGAVVGNQGLMRVTVYKKALCRQPDAVKVNKWTRSQGGLGEGEKGPAELRVDVGVHGSQQVSGCTAQRDQTRC